MFDNSYTQSLQDQLGNLNKLLGGQATLQDVPQAVSRFDCVDGIEGARAFLSKMLSSTKHIVWDSGRDAFYVLQKDANGNPGRIQICEYSVQFEPTMEEKYVSRDDFNALVSKLDQLLSKEVNDG